MKFILYFDRLEQVHLYKEMGMIPYYCNKLYGWDATIACIASKKNEGLVHFRNVRIIRFDKRNDLKQWITDNSLEINMFCVVEPTNENITLIRRYKKHNPSGIAYLKLDLNDKSLPMKYLPRSDRLGTFHELRRRNRLRKLKSKFEYPDLISSETEDGCTNLLTIFSDHPHVSSKIFHLPNGFDTDIFNTQNMDITYEEKENILISVGRIGTYQKNTELLLEALENVEINDWSILFIGPIEPDFEETIYKYFIKNPHLKEKIKFTGNIINKLELYMWYKRAKIFCLTSRWEGFPLVFLEALHHGNYILTTDVSGAADVTNHGRIGTIIEENLCENLIKKLASIFSGEIYDKNVYVEIRKHSGKYRWDNIIQKMYGKIQETKPTK